MAKPTILKERGTGEEMYPHTLASLVHTSTGENVEEAIDEAKLKVFVDMWNQAWGEYGKYDPDNAPDPEHPFMGNELWMTYEEAMRVYVTSIDATSRHITDIRYYFSSINCRTLLPLRHIFGNDWYQAFANCPNLEILRITPTPHFSSCFQAFYGCTKLRRVYGSLNAFNLRNPVNPFVGCTSLEYIEIINLCNNIAFPDSPHLTIECLRYFIQRRLNNNTFTITVHPDVYAKLTGDTTNAAAVALTPEELAQWQQILTDAVAKNITFATT